MLFWVLVIIFHSLPSSVGCSFQSKLFSIFKLLCLVFVRYYLSSRTALENCVLFVIALRSSWENFFADTRFALFSVDCEGELSIRFRKHSPSLPGLVSVIGLYCYHVNMYFYCCVVILSSCKCSQTAELKPCQRESQIDTEDYIPSHFQLLKFCQIFSAVCFIFWTLFSIFGRVVKHGFSCVMYYIIDTTIAVCCFLI